MRAKGKDLGIVLFIVLTAFFFRYLHFASTFWSGEGTSLLEGMRASPGSIFHMSDAGSYTLMAFEYLNKNIPVSPFFPPLVTYFLIAVYSFFGINFYAAKLVYAFINSISLIFIYLSARELFGKSVAMLTIILCAISFPLIFITGGLNIENLYMFFLSAVFFLFIAMYRRNECTGRRFTFLSFIFGAACGTAMLTRPDFVITLFLLFLIGAFKGGWSLKNKIKTAAVVMLGIILTIAPWAYRNYNFMSKVNMHNPNADLPLFVPLSLNGPLNFALAHSSNATGTYPTEFIEKSHGRVFNFTNKDDLEFLLNGYKMGLDFIVNNPGREMELLPVKLKIFFSGFSNGFTLNNFPAGLNGQPIGYGESFIPDSKIALPAMFALFMLGLAALAKNREKGFIKYLPVVFIAASFLTSVAFFALSRYVLPVLPFFYMTISVGIVFIYGRGPLKGYFRYISIISIAVLLVVGAIQAMDKRVFVPSKIGDSNTYKVILQK